MSGSILISDKYGVNPSVTNCFFCGEPMGLALFGRMKGDREAPRNVVLDKNPCDKCKGFMATGVIMISVAKGEDESKGDSPYRTGEFCVLTEESIQRILNPDMAALLLKSRVAFVPDDAWDAIGLPRHDASGNVIKREEGDA